MIASSETPQTCGICDQTIPAGEHHQLTENGGRICLDCASARDNPKGRLW